MSRTTPGFLRGEATRQVIGAIHSGHVAGTWSLEEAATYPSNTGTGMTTLDFKVGVIHPDQPDERATVRITIEEIS